MMHDDQHGTAVVVLAALTNAAKVVGKDFADMRAVISGAGAAGIAVAEILSAPAWETCAARFRASSTATATT